MNLGDSKYVLARYNSTHMLPGGMGLPYSKMIRSYLKNGAYGITFQELANLYKFGLSEFRLDKVTIDGNEIPNTDMDGGSGFMLSQDIFDEIIAGVEGVCPCFSDIGHLKKIDEKTVALYPLTVNITVANHRFGNHNLDIVEELIRFIQQTLVENIGHMMVSNMPRPSYMENRSIFPNLPWGMDQHVQNVMYVNSLQASDVIKLAQMHPDKRGLIKYRWMVNQQTISNLINTGSNNSDEDYHRMNLSNAFKRSYDPLAIDAPYQFMDIPILFNPYMPVSGHTSTTGPVDRPGDPVLFLYNPWKIMNFVYPEISVRHYKPSIEEGGMNITHYIVTMFVGTHSLDHNEIYAVRINEYSDSEDIY